jgi:hypothetical protein
MPSLGVFLQPLLKLEWFSDLPSAQFERNTKRYHRFCPSDFRSVFFDWLFCGGEVVGAELHIFPGEGVLEPFSAIRSLSYVDEDGPFPRIWFFGDRNGEGHGMEAFEACYFVTDMNEWLVCLPVTPWLKENQCQQLRNLLLQ